MKKTVQSNMVTNEGENKFYLYEMMFFSILMILCIIGVTYIVISFIHFNMQSIPVQMPS